jgi:hypothetical protein
MMGYRPKNGMANVAFACGIGAFVSFVALFIVALSEGPDVLLGLCAILTFILGILSVVFGVLGISKSKPLMGTGRTSSVMGLVLGLMSALLLAGVMALGMFVANKDVPSATDEPSTEEADTDDAEAEAEPEEENAEEKAIEEMLADTIWEGHADNGEIACKFTFDPTDKSYSYWDGSSDPASQTGNRVSGHYEIRIDETAYAYVDSLTGMGDNTRQQIADQSLNRNEPVHYMVFHMTPEVDVIDGVEAFHAPASDGSTDTTVWEATFMPDSRHIQMINDSTASVYDFYDSTVPLDQRETAITRLGDMANQLEETQNGDETNAEEGDETNAEEGDEEPQGGETMPENQPDETAEEPEPSEGDA